MTDKRSSNGRRASGSLTRDGLPLTDSAVFWNLSGDLFSVYDAEGRFVDVNPAWERLLGWKRDQLIGSLALDFIHPDDHPAAAAVADKAESGHGRVSDTELRFRGVDGSYRLLTWSIYTDGDGWSGVGKDITERKAAETARDLAQQQATEAYEMTGLSTWRWDPAADHIAFSGEREKTRAALGLPRTLEGTLQMIQSSHRSAMRKTVTRVAEGIDESYCFRYPSVGEKVRWMESRGVAVHGEGGSVETVQGTTQDVTEAELGRLELLRSHNFNQATINSLDDHVAVLDEEGTIVFVNEAWARFASRNGGSGVGVGTSYLGVCDTAPEAGAVAQALRQMLSGSLSSYEVEYPCHSPDQERWFHMRAVRHRGEGPPQVLVQHCDITQRVQAQRGQRLRARMLDQVDAAVVVTDLEGRVTLWSRGAERLYGWSDEEAVGERIEDLTLPTHFHALMPGFTRHLLESGAWEGDLKLRRKDDSHFIGFTRSSVIHDDDGAPIGVVGISVDNTERVHAEQDLRKARDYLTAGIDTMGEGLIAVDPSGDVLYMNATAEERLGWTSDELLGNSLLEKVPFRAPDGSPYPIEECPHMATAVGADAVRAGEDVVIRRDGSHLPISYTSAPFELAEGETGTVMMFADITERKRAEAALRATEVQLKAIIENTTAAIYVKRKGDFRYLLANPEFERVLGLEPGTAVGMRDEDFVPQEVVQAARETDRRVIEEGAQVSLEQEILLAGEPRNFLTLKFPLPDEHGEPYAVCAISTDITERKREEDEQRERLEWEERIRTAVNEDRLLVYTQPIIDLRSGAVVQEELLVRMQGARGPDDVIPPGKFLPQAEKFGLVGEIDRFMIHRGVALAAAGRSVEINLSGHSICDRALIQKIERELHSTGADPAKIIFEITETAAVEDMQAARDFSKRIGALGCRCALDDFGTGFGSLTYQRNLVVQFLKIDISFVGGLVGSKADQQVVKSIVKLAKDYGQHTIAEGVEDEQTLLLLREYGVDYAQGYHIGRPHPVTDR